MELSVQFTLAKLVRFAIFLAPCLSAITWGNTMPGQWSAYARGAKVSANTACQSGSAWGPSWHNDNDNYIALIVVDPLWTRPRLYCWQAIGLTVGQATRSLLNGTATRRVFKRFPIREEY